MLISKIIPKRIKNTTIYIKFRNLIFKALKKITWPIKASIIRHNKYKEIHNFEKKYGVDFGGLIKNGRKLGIKKGEGNGYEPCYDMTHLLSKLNITEEDSFLDIGCGKGWAMYKFSQFPFSKIVGIELNEELINIAKQNLSKLKPEDKRFVFLHQNALDFNDYDDFNYIFMYNTFPLEVFTNFYNKLKQSIERKNRKVYFIYHNPQCRSILDNDTLFKKVYHRDNTAVYMNQTN